MMKMRLAMNGVAPMSSPVALSRRGALGGSESASTSTTTASSAHAANLRPRASPFSSTSSSGLRPEPSGGVYGPRRGSTTLTVTHVATSASTIDETIAK